MNLKPFVNDKKLWDAFNEELTAYITNAHYTMEQVSVDEKELYRLQGEIRAYRKLKKLRDKVNAG